MATTVPVLAVVLCAVVLTVHAACISNITNTATLQAYLVGGGAGYILSLCPGEVYNLTQVLNYTAVNQEISTEGYPTDDTRATLLIGGFNVTTAVAAIATGLDGVKLRNVQINGGRGDSPIYTAPNANIEFGGANSGQLIEYVKTYDPRGWSCMHIAEGPFACSNTTIQYNDIGPCGSQSFQQWADGISLSCSSSLVQHNTIVDATDGGIVIFGSPYSTIRNNTIHVETRTLLGGINMVDIGPWVPLGNYTGVVVENNTINGGFATGYGNSTRGTNNASAIIKIGIAIGPDVWFSDLRYGTNKTSNATVRGNILSGAFAFGLAISSAANLVFEDNAFVNNVSFIGSYGSNCTVSSSTPHPPTEALLEPSSVTNLTLVSPDVAFVNGTALGLTCFVPPGMTEFAWPYGGGGINAAPTVGGSESGGSGSATTSAGTSAASSAATGTSKSAARGRMAGMLDEASVMAVAACIGAVLVGFVTILS